MLLEQKVQSEKKSAYIDTSKLTIPDSSQSDSYEIKFNAYK